MRVAVLSDIHGNLVALDAVLADLERARPNLIVQRGDVAYVGARPAEVVDRIRELGWPGVQGNTDVMLWSGPPVGHPTPASALAWSRLQLGPARLAWLRALPTEWRHDDEIAVVHAVPGDVWPGVLADAPDDLLDETYRRLEARIAVYAHIHVPFVRHLKGLTVANSGSVGLPLDGDTRSSYLLIDDDQIRVRRVEYDIERSIADLRRVGYPGREYVEARQRTARTRRDAREWSPSVPPTFGQDTISQLIGPEWSGPYRAT